MFAEACAFCHGPRGEGGHGGQPLGQAGDAANIAQLVRTGGVEMPALGSSLTSSEIQDVAVYVAERLAVAASQRQR